MGGLAFLFRLLMASSVSRGARKSGNASVESMEEDDVEVLVGGVLLRLPRLSGCTSSSQVSMLASISANRLFFRSRAAFLACFLALRPRGLKTCSIKASAPCPPTSAKAPVRGLATSLKANLVPSTAPLMPCLNAGPTTFLSPKSVTETPPLTRNFAADPRAEAAEPAMSAMGVPAGAMALGGSEEWAVPVQGATSAAATVSVGGGCNSVIRGPELTRRFLLLSGTTEIIGAPVSTAGGGSACTRAGGKAFWIRGFSSRTRGASTTASSSAVGVATSASWACCLLASCLCRCICSCEAVVA